MAVNRVNVKVALELASHKALVRQTYKRQRRHLTGMTPFHRTGGGRISGTLGAVSGT